MLPSYFNNTLSQIIILPFYFIIYIIYFLFYLFLYNFYTKIWVISESKAYGLDISVHVEVFLISMILLGLGFHEDP